MVATCDGLWRLLRWMVVVMMMLMVVMVIVSANGMTAVTARTDIFEALESFIGHTVLVQFEIELLVIVSRDMLEICRRALRNVHSRPSEILRGWRA